MGIIDDAIAGGKTVLGKTPAGKLVGAGAKAVSKGIAGRARFIPIDEGKPELETKGRPSSEFTVPRQS